ncbi:hypothetical protein KCP71_04355 [Salmonella enterica subsp. enterica]|nr:hypothetical protein KCP71_04355 [Salmonella enterica subsp. enterica]
MPRKWCKSYIRTWNNAETAAGERYQVSRRRAGWRRRRLIRLSVPRRIALRRYTPCTRYRYSIRRWKAFSSVWTRLTIL